MFYAFALNGISTHTAAKTSAQSSSNRTQFNASIAAQTSNSASQNHPKPLFKDGLSTYALALGNQIIKTNETLIEIKGGTANKNLKEMPFNYDRIKSDITREKFDSTMRTQDKIISGQKEIIDYLDNKEKYSE